MWYEKVRGFCTVYSIRQEDMKIYDIYEKIVVTSLTAMMAFVLVLAVVDVGYLIVKEVINAPLFLFAIDELLDIFGMFLLVLIGIELIETMRAYMKDHTIRARVVFMVALIAVSRKVIILDIEKYDPLAVVGLAAVILALSVGYYFIRKCESGGCAPTKEDASP
jgi:uncharacterized membrane protein (DUF373 family)